MQQQAYDREKLKSLFHYVVKAAGARPGFGAVKLNKIAWFADTKYYMLHGRGITGSPYVRMQFGPVPKEAHWVREALVREGSITASKGPEYEGWKFRSIRNPDLSRFTRDELDVVNYWLKHIDEEHTASSISDESHDYGWEIAAMGEELPYNAFFASRIREPNTEELEGLRRRAKELGLI